MVSETWFRNLWRFPKKHDGHKDKAVLEVLAFEVASLLSKLVHLWQPLSDKNVAKAVARLARKCNDPKLKSFENCFSEMMKTGLDPYGWQWGWKKMDRKVKKMECYISANGSLYQETEILADLEQTFKKIQSNESATDNLLEFQKKLIWKRHEVKNLQDVSLWNRTYDYTVLLLVISADSDFIGRSHSVSTILTPMSHKSERMMHLL